MCLKASKQKQKQEEEDEDEKEDDVDRIGVEVCEGCYVHVLSNELPRN